MRVACSFLLILCSHALSVRGAILLGNLPPSNESAGTFIQAPILKAVSFTLPASSYSVDSITLRLDMYQSALDTPSVGLYTDNGDKPGTLVGSLLNNPASSSDLVASFTFTPAGTLTLDANSKYWLQVGASGGNFNWYMSSPGIQPAGDASFGAYQWANDGVNFASSITFNSFAIEATAVPEPSQIALATGIGLLGLTLWRRQTRRG